MEGLYPKGVYGSFEEAHARALRLAKDYGSETGVCREGDAWRVYVSRFIEAAFEDIELEDWMIRERDPPEGEEGRREAFDEVMSIWEDNTRSGEEGWFYED